MSDALPFPSRCGALRGRIEKATPREGDFVVCHLRHLSMATLLRYFLVRMVKDILSGDRRRSPLFDPRTLEPIVAPARTIKDPLAHVD